MNATPPHPSGSSNLGKSASPDSTAPSQTSKPNGADKDNQPRRSSFNFLRRQKSGERPAAGRSVSGGKMSKKQKALALAEEEARKRAAAAVPRQPPRLPSHSPLPTINTFGGEENRPDSVAIATNRADYTQAGSYGRPSVDRKMNAAHSVAIPPVPSSSAGSRHGEFVDPYARTESMTHRGRYSYASSAVSTVNSPRRVRRRKDPTPFNILVVGAKSSGKTSFIKFLQSSLALPKQKHQQTQSPPPTGINAPGSPFTSEYLETEMDNERIGVTLWDSQGLEKNIVDLQLREMSSFLESKFEDTFAEEQKVVRAPGVRDTHIHCVFLILDPVRLDANIAASRKANASTSKFHTPPRLVGGLDEDLDLQVLRTMQGKTTVIPVISKADTITTAHMNHLKKTVWDSLKQAKLDPLEALALGDDASDDDSERLDERDEDEYMMSSSDAEDKDDKLIDKLIDRSSQEGARSTTSSRSDASHSHGSASPAHKSGDSERPGEGHRRRVSTMSAALAAAEQEEPEIPYLPLSIISPDEYEPNVIGRRFPWGFADPYNVEHCDFVRLKESVFSEWRAELREASRERWYEGWRTSRLKRKGGTPRRAGTGDGYSIKSAGGPSRSPVNGSTTGRAVSAGGTSPNAAGGSEAHRLYRPANVYQ